MGSIKKKTIPLSLFYLKYLVFILAGIIVVIVTAIGVFWIMINNGVIYPANYAQEQAKKAEKKIGSAEKFSKDLIPVLCKYVLFDKYGNEKEGNLKGSALTAAWAAVNGKNELNSLAGNQYYYIVVQRSEEYCVIAYTFVPQYKSPLLRRYFPGPQNLIIISALLFIILIVIITAIRFGHQLNQKLMPLTSAAGKIQKQELGFTIVPGGITEIDIVINAIDNMRIALKESLESQWKAEQDKKEQIMALAHDLKTPLTLIHGNAELLYDTGLTEEQEELAGYIVNSSLQMQDYIQKLIVITKYGYELQLKKTDTASFFNEIIKQAEGLCAVKNINLNKLCEYKTGYFMADQELLVRAFINIFSNATEYTPEGNEIFFRVNLVNGFIVFKITDTGNGFSKEALEHAMEQFYMDDKSRSSKLHSGIGLYMASLVIKQHNGKMVLGNSSKTGGAEVIIKIPLLYN